MILSLVIKMLCLLVLCPMLLVRGVQTLSIDSQLGTSIEDCFERISIGEQLPPSAIYRNVSELTTRECEQICKQDKQCQAYDYGVGAKGNATCNLSNIGDKEIREKNLLLRNPDYDVYIRRIQCEQGPPKPFQPLEDENSGPQHRPIFRPEDDDPRKPPADDFPTDLRPFETTRPDNIRPYPPYGPYRPSFDDRPDDYNNQVSAFDAPPSYGAHRPQDIPYRPVRPYKNYTDPYDVLHFQGGKPPYFRPHPQYPPRPYDDISALYGQKPLPPLRPNLPPYRPEKPEFVYVNRPNRRPERPTADNGSPGYGNEPLDYPPDPYGPNADHRRPYKPVHYPYRPHEKPTYDYNNQYAENYGQNQYNDNSIYVEIYDPPRPYRPSKPSDDRPLSNSGYGQGYGYGSQNDFSNYGGSSQNTYIHNSLSSNYGSDINENYNKPTNIRPYRPPEETSEYGAQNTKPDKPYKRPESDGYGSQSDISKPQKPTYDPVQSTHPSNYGQTSQHSGYEQANDQSYSSQSSGYGSSHKPQDYERPSYNKPFSNYGSFGSNQDSYSSYGNHQSPYGQSDFSSSYGSSNHNFQSSYGGHLYGTYNQKPIKGTQPYGNRPIYDERPFYDSPPYGHRPSNNKPAYDNRPVYNYPIYDQKPLYDEIPSYGQKPVHDPHYNKPLDASYGQKPNDEQTGYGQKPNHNKPVHKPSHDSPYGQKPNDDTGYGQKPSHNKPAYGNEPPYDNDRPDGEIGADFSNGYKNNVKNQSSSNNKLEVKPVYENEMEKPINVPSYILRPGGEVITSRPVSIGDYAERPYGREPVLSYKACFRRVLAGKRALRSFVRRVVPCERLEDCRRECADERRFHCESFNYRLDPSFRGKGLCEMMTKPIEAFDLRRDFVEDKDYDFFELDRNSLEPHCPETLKGPGMLHSGYLSSKESYQSSWDRNDYPDRDRDRNRFIDDRRYQGSRRRYQDRLFVPYQIGLPRSADDQDVWGQYGGQYGTSYYKDRNDYHKSISHWGLNDLDPPEYGVRPRGNNNFNYYDLGKKIDRYNYGAWKRGRWDVPSLPPSGPSSLDYGESNYVRPPKTPVYLESREGASDESGGEVVVKDCSSRRRPGMSLGSGSVRRALTAPTVVQCEAACFTEREFKCVSYSYRYSHSGGSDNCYLSERAYRGLQLAADSGSDVYAMPDRACDVTLRPIVESECFWHVRSGAAVSDTAVKAALTVAGLGACEAECIRAHDFFCRGFSFRFDAPTIGDDLANCILTSTPPTSLERGRGLRPSAGHELYARGNYGRGCEPALYDDSDNRVTADSGECYLQYDSAAKLVGAAVKGSARVKDERSCGKACTDAPFRCLSFSFTNDAPEGDNCLLSEIRLFDLQRGVDYEHSANDWLFAFDLFNGQCWRKVHGRGDHESPSGELPRPITPHRPGPQGPPTPAHAGPSAPSGPSGVGTGHGYLPVAGTAPGSPPPGPSNRPHRPHYPPPGYLPAEPPGYLPQPGYEPAPPYRPEGRPSGPSYLPTGPSDPGYPKDPYRPERPRPERPYPDPYAPPLPSPPVYRPPGGDPYEPRPEYGDRPYRPSGPEYGHVPTRPGYGPSGPPGPALPPTIQYGPAGPPTGPGANVPGPYEPRPPSIPGPQIQYGPGGPPGLGPDEPYGPPGPSGPEPNGPPIPPREEEPIAVSWRHYTVSGFPCRQGTSCAQNQVAGHWSCEPEGGEIGAWDYCCAPTHRCGYSEGFHKPWCYVGPSREQWRPCSEKYYPYHQHNIPHPSQAQGAPVPESIRAPPGAGPVPQPGAGPVPQPGAGPVPLPGAYARPDLSYLPEADRRYWDDLYKNGPKAYYDQYGNPLPGYTRVPTAERPYIKYHHNHPLPSSGNWVPVNHPSEVDPPVPGGLGVPRYWPVAYLHKGPPPNTTYFKYNQTEKPPVTYPSMRPITPSRENSLDRDRYNPRDPTRERDRDSSRDPSRESNRYVPPRDDNRDRNNKDYSREPSRNENRERDPNRERPLEPNSDASDRDTNREMNPPRERTTYSRIDPDRPPNNNIEIQNRRDEKTRNITDANDDLLKTDSVNTTTPKTENNVSVKADNTSDTETVKRDENITKIDDEKEADGLKGIDGKIDDFSKSIEVLDIEDAKKGDKLSDLKMLEAEERQIEAIGRLLAERRGQKLVLEKRSQKDLETKSIALDKDLVDFNFGNKFPASNVERRGTVQRVSKAEIARDRLMDKSLEVSETTFVRPPRVLSTTTTENIRKAIVNGKIFYSANLRDQREINSTISPIKTYHTASPFTNSTRKPKSLNLRPLEERAPSIIGNANNGKKKVLRTRNVNPVRKNRRVYRRKYNPDEVRRRLLERERSMKDDAKKN